MIAPDVVHCRRRQPSKQSRVAAGGTCPPPARGACLQPAGPGPAATRGQFQNHLSIGIHIIMYKLNFNLRYKIYIADLYIVYMYSRRIRKPYIIAPS